MTTTRRCTCGHRWPGIDQPTTCRAWAVSWWDAGCA